MAMEEKTRRRWQSNRPQSYGASLVRQLWQSLQPKLDRAAMDRPSNEAADPFMGNGLVANVEPDLVIPHDG